MSVTVQSGALLYSPLKPSNPRTDYWGSLFSLAVRLAVLVGARASTLVPDNSNPYPGGGPGFDPEHWQWQHLVVAATRSVAIMDAGHGLLVMVCWLRVVAAGIT